MKNKLLKAVASLAIFVFAVALAVPALTLAESAQQQSMFDTPLVQTPKQEVASGQADGDCTLAIKYYEGVWYDDPDVEVDEDGRIYLGEYVVTGLHEGDVVDAWDYVVDIPGHIFFDGWPATVTISSDPSQNELTLIYAKLWDSEYTVNYYMMVGADLTADNWTDALAPEGVEFIKLGSETFENQRYDSLVKGDAYEYQLDGMYVIDTYPAQIRLDVNPDNNVINVLYTPDSVTLPDDMEIYDLTTLPDAVEVPEVAGGDGSSDGTLPDDTTMSKDDLIALLPDSILVPNGVGGLEEGDSSVIEDDFLGSDIGEGELEITDEMLSNPQNKDEATALKNAYKTGVHQSSEAAKMGDFLRITPYICIALLAAVIFFVCAFLLERRKNKSE